MTGPGGSQGGQGGSFSVSIFAACEPWGPHHRQVAWKHPIVPSTSQVKAESKCMPSPRAVDLLRSLTAANLERVWANFKSLIGNSKVNIIATKSELRPCISFLVWWGDPKIKTRDMTWRNRSDFSLAPLNSRKVRTIRMARNAFLTKVSGQERSHGEVLLHEGRVEIGQGWLRLVKVGKA